MPTPPVNARATWRSKDSAHAIELVVSPTGVLEHASLGAVRAFHAVGWKPGTELPQELRPLVSSVARTGRADALEIDVGGRRILFIASRYIGERAAPGSVELIARDVTHERDAERRQAATASRMTALLTRLRNGILVEDADRRVVLANEEFCRIFGVRVAPEQLVGRDCEGAAVAAAQHFDDPAAFLATIDQRLAEHVPVHGERLFMSDGRVLERDFVPVGEHGQLWRYRDVTSDVRATQRLEDERDSADDANRMKTEFLAMMSHEIRTPMNAILGMAELALDHAVEPEARRLIERVHANASALVYLINDVLDLSKVEAGELHLRQEAFDPRTLVTEVVDTFSPFAEAKGVELSATVTPDVAPALIGDQFRLRQILTNLVGNAVDFTSEGSVRVTMRGDSPVRITVEDTGVGIAPEHLEKIFDRFQQGTRRTDRAQSGTGLGLTITRSLCQLMGGDVSVTSQLGRGSTFAVHLALPGAPGVSPPAPAQETHSLRGAPRVLLVEDNVDNQRYAARVLTHAGCVVRVAIDGQTGSDMFTPGAFDLVITDLDMPHRDGWQLCEAIREREAIGGSPRTPVVALTAHALDGMGDRCLSAGMDGYATKPITRDELIALVDTHAAFVPTVLVVDDSDDSRWLIQRRLKSEKWHVETASDAAEALDRVARGGIDLVLSDVEMPTVSGFELGQQLQELEAPPAFALISGHDAADIEARARTVGCVHVFQKPVRGDVLRRHVADLLQLGSGRPLRQTILIDADIADLVPGYLTSRREEIGALRALQDQGAFTDLAKRGHNLKGSGAAYGFDELTALGGALEDAANAEDPAAVEAVVTHIERYVREVEWKAEP